MSTWLWTVIDVPGKDPLERPASLQGLRSLSKASLTWVDSRHLRLQCVIPIYNKSVDKKTGRRGGHKAYEKVFPYCPFPKWERSCCFRCPFSKVLLSPSPFCSFPLHPSVLKPHFDLECRWQMTYIYDTWFCFIFSIYWTGENVIKYWTKIFHTKYCWVKILSNIEGRKLLPNIEERKLSYLSLSQI